MILINDSQWCCMIERNRQIKERKKRKQNEFLVALTDVKIKAIIFIIQVTH